MKKISLASSLVVLLLALTSSPRPALAQIPEINDRPPIIQFPKKSFEIEGKRFYAGVSAGIFIPKDRFTSVKYPPQYSVYNESMMGWIIGAKFGARLNSFLAGEIETNFLQYQTRAFSSAAPTQPLWPRTYSRHRNDHFYNFVNLVLAPFGDFLAFNGCLGSFKIRPELSAGIGALTELAVHTRTKVVSTAPLPTVYGRTWLAMKHSVAANLGFALKVNYSKSLDLGVKYRYFWANNERTVAQGPPPPSSSSIIIVYRNESAHALTAEANLHF